MGTVCVSGNVCVTVCVCVRVQGVNIPLRAQLAPPLNQANESSSFSPD